LPANQPLLIDGRVPYDMAIWGEYFRRGEYHRRHHVRYKAYVAIKGNGFTCQECGGAGGETEPVLDDGSGPWYGCGFCEGTGLVTRWMRGQWLRWKAIEKLERERKQATKKQAA
jgi:hypothetical protein